MLIQEDSEDQPHLFKDYYLRTSTELRTLAIVRSVDKGLLMAVVTKEVVLGHIAEFF